MAFWEIVVEGRQGAQDMLTVLHYNDGGSVTPDFDVVASVFENHIGTHVAPWCGPRVTWVGITVREDLPGSVGTFVPMPNAPLLGTSTEADQADVLALMIKKLSGGLVRPTYGWIMQGGITAHGLTSASTWEPAILADMEAYAEDIKTINPGGGVTLNMVIKASNPTAPNTQAYSQVTTFQARVQPRTQRSRLPFAGS